MQLLATLTMPVKRIFGLMDARDKGKGMQMQPSIPQATRNPDAVKRSRVKSGIGKPPFGFVPDNGAWTIDSTKAAIVRRIFMEYSSGFSTAQIADRLNNEGIPTQQGKEWSKQTIAYILGNPQYTQKAACNTADGQEFKAIISKRAFEKVQDRKQSSTRRKPQLIDGGLPNGRIAKSL